VFAYKVAFLFTLHAEGPQKKNRVVEILTRFLRWRPALSELQARNIVKGNVDSTKTALERNEAKKKLTQWFGQYQKPGSKGKADKAFPQFGIDPTTLGQMYPDQPMGIPRLLSVCFAYLEKSMYCALFVPCL
jgi:hypothetical protein